jgi:hypothetical protein
MFTADDEDDQGKQSLTIFQQALGWTIINLPHHGHYISDDMQTDQFPELIKQIL